MPRILQVLPYGNLNGTERHVHLLARHAREAGWDATVALPPGPMRDLLHDEGIPVLELPPIRLTTFPSVIRAIRRAMATHDLCHVHAAMEMVLGMGLKPPFPVVFTAHCYHTDLDYAKAGFFLNRGCSATVSVSGAERARLLKGGLDPARHQTILNGIDLEPFQSAPPSGLRDELNLSPEVMLVGTIGRLSKLKRVDVLIRALANSRDSIHLAVAGDGDQRRALEALADRLGVTERLHWLGRRQDVANVLGGFDVFASASEREGLSLAALEAMASGLPLTVSAIAEFEEVADSRWAFALPPGRPEGWASSWDALYADPERRKRMGDAARAGSEGFTATRVGAETLALYRKILKLEGESEEPGSLRSAGSLPASPAS